MTAFCVIKKIAEDLFGEIFCCLKISNVRVKFHVKYTYFLFFELFFMNSTEFADVVVWFSLDPFARFDGFLAPPRILRTRMTHFLSHDVEQNTPNANVSHITSSQ